MVIKDKKIIEYLKSRDGKETLLKLSDGSVLKIWNVTWGYDLGDEYAHITTNISPKVPNSKNDFFYTNEIDEILDRT